VIAQLELDRRLERAGQAVGYLAAGLPIAILGVLAVLCLAVGAALSVVGVGLPLLLASAAACRRLVRLDRRAANHFLHTQIPALPGTPRTAGSPWRRSLELLSDRTLWRQVAVLALKPVIGLGVLVVGLAPVVLLAELISLGVQGVGGFGDVDYLGPWTFGPVVGVALCLLAVPAAVLVVATLEALRTVMRTILRALLVPRAAASGPVREFLAESLGDHSVAIAYWLPDREAFVDEVGRRVELPDPGSGRTWTAVERDGRPVAAIVHDAALDTSRELVHAAAAASSLAIDNERLKADLRARLQELRVSRLRIVEAADAARRRIERDLHDGAQQQLVALSLELRLLRARLKDADAVPLVDGISDRLATALVELRELARGIHPALLTERGLGPAIAGLADRVPLAVDCDVQVAERLPAPVEAAAYFLVAEALTNVTKYAQARRVVVELVHERAQLLVRVADDGVGGVVVTAGSGLRGLQDRLAAVDGTLFIDSPPGAGTRLEARIPCAALPGAEGPAAVLDEARA
jgi:signal transduction histidine kinase